MSHLRRTFDAITTPTWARNLTEDDEWVVRTALVNVAADLKAIAKSGDLTPGGAAVMIECAERYEQALERIEAA